MIPAREPLVVEVRRGGRVLRAVAVQLGGDVVVSVGGGVRPHVGCVVLAQARSAAADPPRTPVSVSVLTIPPHKEEALARPVAEAVARACGGTVVVAAGVHEPGLGPEGIAAWLEMGGELARRLAAELGGRTGTGAPA